MSLRSPGYDRSSYATTTLFAARDWIAGRMQAEGLTVSTPNFTMNSPGGSITRQNVLGMWTGTVTPNEWIIVGAHYDSRNGNANSTTGTPGAEDNASGCAGVLELARVLVPRQPGRSLLFMCYAGEEQGLLGSAAHVQSLTTNNHLARVQAVVIMDMIGYSADTQLQALYESEPEFLSYMQRFGAAASTYVPQLNVVYSTNPFGSDHMPYLNAGVQTLLAIEDDWDIYGHYHRSTDTPANMGPNAQAMGGAILKTNAAVLAELAGLLPPAMFSDGFE
ncbi:MAG: M28 family peptidase [Ahniella sp.]|nr:M28 family peptidase [Ahniella sp.]